MEYPQAPSEGPKTRINWTQTTTITLAAFIGCLAALAMLYFLYKSRLGDSLRKKQGLVDQLNGRIDDLSDEYRYKLARRDTPLTGKRKMDPSTDETSDKEDGQGQEAESDQDDQTSQDSEVETKVETRKPGKSVLTTPTV